MNLTFRKIAVIGLGYIGLPTAAMFASRGIDVVGVDIDSNTVNTINSGKVHIIEPDLDSMVYDTVNTGNLYAVTIPEPADAFLITVPSPFKDNHKPDVSFIESAINSIAPVLSKGNLIIIESTSPVGTTELISQQLATLRNDLIFPHQDCNKTDIHIAYCPERVMPGQIIHELINNDRIIGGITPQCTDKAKSLYSLFVKGECISTDSRTAEMAKLTENAFRDVNIAFANELSIICDKLEIDVWELIKLANRHPRVNILQPGPGVGGHCIAVDPWFIVHAAPHEANLIRTAREVNDNKPMYVLDKINKAAAFFEYPRIACLGLAYKPNTDDLRESPAVRIVQELGFISNVNITIVEPNITTLPSFLAGYKQFKLTHLEEALASSEIVVLLVAHNEFKDVNKNKFEGKIFINIVNWETSQLHPASYQRDSHPSPGVSEYGLMMMNRIYGQIFP